MFTLELDICTGLKSAGWGALIACKIDCGATVIHHIRHLLTKSTGIGMHIYVNLLGKDST